MPASASDLGCRAGVYHTDGNCAALGYTPFEQNLGEQPQHTHRFSE